jgi:hypothetical protein
MMKMTIEDLAIAFVNGDFDDDLEVVFGLYKDRHAQLRQKKQAVLKATIKAGDTGVIEGLSPKYLNGVHVTVKKVEGTKLSVRPTRDMDKWMMRKYSSGVTIPITCFKPVVEPEGAGATVDLEPLNDRPVRGHRDTMWEA